MDINYGYTQELQIEVELLGGVFSAQVAVDLVVEDGKLSIEEVHEVIVFVEGSEVDVMNFTRDEDVGRYLSELIIKEAKDLIDDFDNA